MAEPAQPKLGRVLSTDAFEGTLDLLVAEERRGEAHTAGRLTHHLAVTLSGLLGALGVPLGALIRPIDPRLGQPLLIAGLAAVAVFTLLNTRRREGPVLALDALRAAVEPVSGPRTEAQTRRRRWLGWLALGLGALYFAAGLAWLLYGLLAQRQVNLLALGLVAWALLCVWLLAARHGYQAYQQQRQVGRLRRSFASRYVEARRGEQPQVTVPDDEAAAFARVQQRHIDANFRRALRAWPADAGDPHAVVIMPEAHAALRALPAEAQVALYERLGQLQTAPRPEGAQPASDGAGWMLFEAGNTLLYAVNDETQRIIVTTVAEAVESVDGG